MEEKSPSSQSVPRKAWLPFVVLHAILLLYSIAAILSKTAAGFDFFSTAFILCYGGVLLLLVVYALVWQWVLKSLPLTIAYANKGITIIWGMVWGFLIFGESISLTMILGAALVFIGIMLVVTDRG